MDCPNKDYRIRGLTWAASGKLFWGLVYLEIKFIRFQLYWELQWTIWELCMKVKSYKDSNMFRNINIVYCSYNWLVHDFSYYQLSVKQMFGTFCQNCDSFFSLLTSILIMFIFFCKIIAMAAELRIFPIQRIVVINAQILFRPHSSLQ